MPDLEDLVVPIGGLLIAGIAAFSGGGDSIGGMMSNGGQVKELRQSNALENILRQTENEGLQQESQTALQRYQNGCIVHAVRSANQRPEDVAVGAITVEYRRVVAGVQLMDFNNNPYSPGALLCDAWGMTGIVQNDGTVGSTAYTGEDISGYVEAHFGRYN